MNKNGRILCITVSVGTTCVEAGNNADFIEATSNLGKDDDDDPICVIVSACTRLKSGIPVSSSS
jgi:hypothetical protein